MDVADFEEFEQWVSGKAQPTKFHYFFYKSSLQKFCEFHGKNPRKLIAEVREPSKEDSEEPGLEENVVEQRLKKFYSHLVTSKEEGGEGWSRETAVIYFQHIKSFYTKFGSPVNLKTPPSDVANKVAEVSWRKGGTDRVN